MKIGYRIRCKREELGISQEELAFKLGYKSRSSVNKIERNAGNLPQSKIIAIANALQTTPSYLMGWEDEEERSICDMEENCDQNLMKKYMRLDDEDKIRIQERIDTMLESEKYSRNSIKKRMA